MSSFLGKDLERFHRSLLQLVIKLDVLEKCESPAVLLQIDFLDKNIYLKLRDINFGFSVEEKFKNLQGQDISIVEIMSEKSPFNYCLVRTAAVFDLVLMVSSTPLHLRSKMKERLTHLVSLKGISFNLVEKVLSQYSELLTLLTQYHFEIAKVFDHRESRLDDIFFQKAFLKIPNELKAISTLVLVFSHGQASLERGFNTSKSISKVNLSEKSMVSRKMIIDYLQKKKTVYYHQLLSSPTIFLSL